MNHEHTVSPSLLVAEANTRYNVFPTLSRGWLPALRACSALRFAAAFKSLESSSSVACPAASVPAARLRLASLMASSSAPPVNRKLEPGWASVTPP